MSSRRRRRQRPASPDPPSSPESDENEHDNQHESENDEEMDEGLDDVEMDQSGQSPSQYQSQSQSRSQSRSQSQSQSQSRSQSQPSSPIEADAEDEDEDNDVPEIDEETLRVLVSTDNHLGYAERDPIRGNDSFAAFEEVLLLAKRHHCDMVLLAGDLFHENKPTRRTIHKTMNILRRYTMGPNPISFQVISDQSKNFRSTVFPHNTVNYEHPYMSIDLPIFSIHGNHDDPTRDGGDEMLAALDILAMGNLLNYFGRQDEVDKVQVSPVLIKKGNTKVALYGMGSMRDERLNRMWQGKKVRFLKPERSSNGGDGDDGDDDHHRNSDSEENEEEAEWFNIFALHQNRDLGRGAKNCVHESMIPEWMDLVVWGHEHECIINPSESAVGTFRISQPGSSVATSLTEGESLTKHVGILDIRGSQFRLKPVPLMQVRSFTMGHICLSETGLDAEDLRVDEAMADILSKEVEKLIREARKSSRMLTDNANGDRNQSGGNGEQGHDEIDPDEDKALSKKLYFHVQKPDRVLVRLKVEHSGFETLNNQRFGSRFVNEVANPSDILLFHRKRVTEATTTNASKRGAANRNNDVPTEPTYPAELDEINVAEVVKDTLESTEKKLQILDEDKLSIAVEDFVSKEQRQMIHDTVAKIVTIQQKMLVKRGVDTSMEDDGDSQKDGKVKVTTANAVREVCQAETQKIREGEFSMDIEGEDSDEEEEVTKKKKPAAKKRGQKMKDDSDDEFTQASSQRKKRNGSSSVSRARGRGRAAVENSESDFEDDEEESPKPQRKKRKAPTKKRGRALEKSESEEEEDDEIVEDFSPQSRRGNRSVSKANGRGRSRRAATKRSYTEDVVVIDEDDEDDAVEHSGWGSVSSKSTKRSRRRR